jgi:hypothetical protein
MFYYNYLKNYKEEAVEGEKFPKFNRTDLSGVEFDTESIQLELEKDNNYQRNEEKGKARIAGDNIIEASSTPVGGQSDFRNNYTTDNLIRSTLSKLYLMLIIYMVELVPFFLFQTLFKFLNIQISSTLDSAGNFLTQLVPITNPCFVLFFHFETYQELRFIIYVNYYKFFK